jgi:integrase
MGKVGRKAAPYWSDSRGQYLVMIRGKLHRLGTDLEKATAKFNLLMRDETEQTKEANPLLADLFNSWLEVVYEEKGDTKPFKNRKRILTLLVKFLGVGTRLDEVRASHVSNFIKSLGELSPSSVRSYTAHILAALNWCATPIARKGGELIPSNPLKGQLFLPVGKSRGKEAVWTGESMKQVLACGSEAFCNIVKILAWTGARPSLICRIEAKHYNKGQSRWDTADLFEERTGHSKKKNVLHVRILNDEARNLIEQLNEKHPTGPIFRNSKGGNWTSNALHTYLYGLMWRFEPSCKLKWQEGLCIYGIRHTFATSFLQKYPGEIEYLRILLGHSDYQMIFRNYGHLIDQHREAFKRLEGFNPIG